MATNNGGWTTYPDQVIKATFARASDRETRGGVVKAGQVLKALSFVETDVNGKWVAHKGLVESATVVFAPVATTLVVTLAGLTFTAGATSVTAIQLADLWSDLPTNATAAQANALRDAKGYTALGAFTNALVGYSTTKVTTTKVRFDATGVGVVDTTDVTSSGSGSASAAVTLVAFASFNKVSGVLVFDIDATGSADVKATVYTEASFWADALVWAVDVSVDTITTANGSIVPCTAYNTGCAGTSTESNLLKAKFVENTEFEPLTFKNTGETY